MKHVRSVAIVCVILLAGAFAAAVLDWRQEQRLAMETSRQSAEGMISLLALYPLSDTDPGTRRLLAKSLVEQSGASIAYLTVERADGEILLNIGNPAVRAVGFALPAGSMSVRSGERRFSTPNGHDILELSRRMIREDQGGTVVLGVRLIRRPLISIARIGSVAAVVFLMLGAIIVGYYAIVLAFRRGEPAGAGPGPAGARSPDDNILAAMDRMRQEWAQTQDTLRAMAEKNADLSSRLGVTAFESRHAYEVLDALSFGIMILDAQSRITRVNRAMLELLGGERVSYEGCACGEAVQHDTIVQVADEMQDGAVAGTITVEASFAETAPESHFEVTGRPLTDAAGDRIGALVTTQDITRMKRAHKAQEDFLAEASHELLTPLTSIKSYAELLSSGDYDAEETRKEFYNTINTETDRLTDLVRNLLNVSKFETGQLDMERALVKTDWLIDQCLPAVEAGAEKKQISIEKRMPDVFPTILGDKEMLKVVLVNVLGNAVKYTPEGGTVRLALFQQDHNVFLEVSDTGCGIPPEELPRVFEKFYRGRGHGVREQVGSGLGLATALQIARLHGGAIDVTSEPGKGTCVTVSIPVEEYSLEK